MSASPADLTLATEVTVIWLAFWIVDRHLKPFTSRELGFWACWYSATAIWCLSSGDNPVTMLAGGAFAGWCAYHAWKRRKPRQRKPSKVGARVRDLGHRLVVINS